ncbi:MAG: ankyrin repeat domain-containing protein [Candidatus Riflebacteria bacterium]|nr:ankyrin repeat domain-containing protein [Candidatus Riflebacteria bacterium]
MSDKKETGCATGFFAIIFAIFAGLSFIFVIGQEAGVWGNQKNVFGGKGALILAYIIVPGLFVLMGIILGWMNRPPKKKPVIQALDEGDIGLLREIVEKNPEVINYKEKECSSLVGYAAKKNQLVSTRFLIESGAAISVSDKEGYTPLHYAVESGNLPLTKLLVESGANLSARIIEPACYRGLTPPEFAEKLRKTHIIEYFKEVVTSKSKK